MAVTVYWLTPIPISPVSDRNLATQLGSRAIDEVISVFLCLLSQARGNCSFPFPLTQYHSWSTSDVSGAVGNEESGDRQG